METLTRYSKTVRYLQRSIALVCFQRAPIRCADPIKAIHHSLGSGDGVLCGKGLASSILPESTIPLFASLQASNNVNS